MLVKIATMNGSTTKLGIYLSWPFLLAIVLFGTNLLFYAQAIRQIALYIAYPFVVGITIIVLTIFSHFNYFNKIQVHELFAIVLILFGIVLLSK